MVTLECAQGWPETGPSAQRSSCSVQQIPVSQVKSGVGSPSKPGSALAGKPVSNSDMLQDDVMGAILSLLGPAQLHRAELVSSQLRGTVILYELWRHICCLGCANFASTVAAVDSQALESLFATWQPVSFSSRPSAAGLAPGSQPQQAWSQPGNEAAKPACGSQAQTPTTLPAPAAIAKPQHPTSLPALCLSAENSMSSQGEESTAPAERMLFADLLAGDGPAAAAEHASEAGSKQAPLRLPPAELQGGSAVAEHPSELEYEPARAAEAPSGSPAGSNGQVATAGLPGAVPVDVQSQRWTPQQELQSLGHKHLAWRLGAASEESSLIAEALSASSTDNPEEALHNVLNPSTRSRSLWQPNYWSSAGSESASANEVLTFRLAHPLCLVREVQIHPFRAHFQLGDPVYSSQRVRFTFGGVPCFESQGQPLPAASIVACEQAAAAVDAGWRQAAWSALGTCSEGQGSCRSPSPDAGPARRWVTQEFEMRPHDGLQTFQLNPGVLCVGGHLQVELIGKVQRQAADERFYICLAHVRVNGVPLYNHLPRALQPATGSCKPGLATTSAPIAQRINCQEQIELLVVSRDPLRERGGLLLASEMGRLVLDAAGHQANSDDEDVLGDSDDNDFFQEHVPEWDQDSSSDDEGIPLPGLLAPLGAVYDFE